MLLFMTLTLTALAGTMEFPGKITTVDGGGKGAVTVSESTIEVEAKKLFSKESFTVHLGDAKTLRVKQGLMHTTVLMTMKDDSVVTVSTKRKYYGELKALLKSRVT